MQQIEQKPAAAGTERRRVESVVQTLANLRGEGETLVAVAHDARNMVSALGLYCDLLEEPGVLAPDFAHYGGELRLVAAASRRLVEKLVALDEHGAAQGSFWRNEAPATEQWPAQLSGSRRGTGWDPVPSAPVANLAAELLATRNLLAALAGPSVALTVEVQGGALPARISGEDLTRVLVNLVKNAVEAMPTGGRIQIALREQCAGGGETGGGEAREVKARETGPGGGTRSGPKWLVLSIEDNGPGIPAEALPRIFESGYTSHAPAAGEAGNRAIAHRGLGLAITRSIVEAAGGRIYAENRRAGGARIALELPANPDSRR